MAGALMQNIIRVYTVSLYAELIKRIPTSLKPERDKRLKSELQNC